MTAEELLAHSDFVRRLARGLVRPDQVDDVVQETFVAALRKPPRHESLRAWLATVARNASRTVLRAQSRRRRHERAAARGEGTASVAAAVSRVELHGLVVQEVLALAEPYRLAVILRFFENLPPREIARRTGAPVGTVRVRLRRALEQLRGRLDRHHGGDRRAWSLALLPFAGLDRTALAATATGAAVVGKKTAAVLVVWAVTATGLFVHSRATRPAAPPPRADRVEVASNGGPAAAAPAKRELSPTEEMNEFMRRWTASRSGRLDVRVVDTKGAPVESVAVTLTGTLPDQSIVTYEATSDEQGRLDLPEMRYPLTYAAQCSAASLGVDQRLRLYIPDIGKPLSLTVTPRPVVRGLLRSKQGAPIAGGVIHYTAALPGSSSNTWGRIETGDDGRFSKTLLQKPGEDEKLRVSAAAPGYLPGFGTAKRDERGNWTLEAELEPGPAVRGVLHDHDGKPLANHEIHFWAKRTYPIGERPEQPDRELLQHFAMGAGTDSSKGDGKERQTIGVRIKTDAEGRFEGWFAFAPEEAWISVQRKEGRRWDRSIDPAPVVDLGTITLPRPEPAITLHILNENGEPMPGAYVMIRAPGEPLARSIRYTADQKGLVRTFDLAAGETYEATVLDTKRGGQAKATFVASDGVELRYERER